jgi:hypothetical protein
MSRNIGRLKTKENRWKKDQNIARMKAKSSTPTTVQKSQRVLKAGFNPARCGGFAAV